MAKLDISFQVFSNPVDHALATVLEEANRWQRGDIFNAMLTSDVATWDAVESEYRVTEGIGSRRMVFFHVLNIPNNPPNFIAQKIRKNIAREWIEVKAGPSGPDDSSWTPPRTFRKRRAMIPPELVPQWVRDKLALQKEVTIEYSQIAPHIQIKNMVDILNRLLDIRSTVTITDLEDD